jgi:predicted house-cleaning noncanonical NTP pyrophosphatase (MazG superfamily)
MPKLTKLVRDRVPEIMHREGVAYEIYVATEHEFRIALFDKLIEETWEFIENPTAEELSDVVEVINALRLLPEYRAVEEVRARKREERGAFEKRIIVTTGSVR